MYFQLIYLEVKVKCVHLQKKSLLKEGDPKLADIESEMRECRRGERYYETEVNRHQKYLEELMSEKNKHEC